MVYRWWSWWWWWGLYSGGSSVDGDSILIAQQPKAVEGAERNAWKLWETRGRGGRHCILSIIYNIRKRCFVDGSEFDQKKGGATAGGMCCEEIEVQQREWSKWEAITREMDRQTVLPNSRALTVD